MCWKKKQQHYLHLSGSLTPKTAAVVLTLVAGGFFFFQSFSKQGWFLDALLLKQKLPANRPNGDTRPTSETSASSAAFSSSPAALPALPHSPLSEDMHTTRCSQNQQGFTPTVYQSNVSWDKAWLLPERFCINDKVKETQTISFCLSNNYVQSHIFHILIMTVASTMALS